MRFPSRFKPDAGLVVFKGSDLHLIELKGAIDPPAAPTILASEQDLTHGLNVWHLADQDNLSLNQICPLRITTSRLSITSA